MLVIRLFRVGKKNQPAFKIVVADKKNPTKAGRFVEEVGFWSPLTNEKVLKGERIKYWISVGAQPSVTIHNLLVKEKVIEGKKIPNHSMPKKKEGEKPAEAEVKPATVAPAAVKAAPASAAPAAPKPAEEKKAPAAPASVKTSAGKEKPKETPADKK